VTLKRVAIGLGVFVLLAAAGAGAAWWWNERQTKDVRGSSTREFDTTEEATTRAEEEIDTEPWPIYGLTPDRTRNAVDFDHRPPFRRAWVVKGNGLLEFPPVIAYGRLYFSNQYGRFSAISAESGKRVWQRRLGYVTAASPAVGDGIVYQPFMSRVGQERGDSSGLVIAMDAETGNVLWRFKAGAVESSPLLVQGSLYFGSFDGNVYSLDAQTGKVRWRFKTGGRVKGGPALSHGVLFAGAYDGKLYAIDAATGHKRWVAKGQSGLFGSGTFYAGPAVAYGRVFIGNTSGKVYAFGAKSGDLLWSKTTANYVYSSAAVVDRRIFVGSYDGHFYALDAATGDTAWSVDAHGQISGSPTVMAGAVYFSTLAGKTYALDTRTGKVVWTFPDGRYTPLVADADRTYIVGKNKIYAFTSRT
jgi:outer membrane protein assembly factor BamB